MRHMGDMTRSHDGMMTLAIYITARLARYASYKVDDAKVVCWRNMFLAAIYPHSQNPRVLFLRSLETLACSVCIRIAQLCFVRRLYVRVLSVVAMLQRLCRSGKLRSFACATV
jgi:hypothetical protein